MTTSARDLNKRLVNLLIEVDVKEETIKGLTKQIVLLQNDLNIANMSIKELKAMSRVGDDVHLRLRKMLESTGEAPKDKDTIENLKLVIHSLQKDIVDLEKEIKQINKGKMHGSVKPNKVCD